MPVRTVSNRGRRNVVGYFPSLKMHRLVQFESTLERDLICLLDFAPHVAGFEEQPLAISYDHQGKTLSYTPDFQVTFRSGRMALLECKPHCFVENEENQRKFRAAQTWCEKQGWTFHVVTEEHLRLNCRVQNVIWLTQHARHEVGVEVKRRIFRFLAHANRPVTIGEVLLGVNPANPTAVIVPILQMAYHHELSLPLNHAPLSSQSPLCLPGLAGEIGEADEYRTIFNG